MDDLDSRRGTFRLGAMTTTMAVLFLGLALAPPRAADALWLIPVGLFGVTGIGLLRHNRFARVVAGVAFLVGAVVTPLSLVQALARGGAPSSIGVAWLLVVANAVATTLLGSWLCSCALRTLLGRAPLAGNVTVRLVGGVLAIVAASHLWLALEFDGGNSAGWAFHVSSEGTSLLGFPGWPVWHGVAFVLGLVLVAGPPGVLGVATTLLVGLFAALVPLMLVAVLGIGGFPLELTLTFVVMTLVPVYLAWWLRDEVRRCSRAGAPIV